MLEPRTTVDEQLSVLFAILGAAVLLVGVVAAGSGLTEIFVGAFYKYLVVVISTIESLDFTKATFTANYMERYAFSLVCLVSFLRETFYNDDVVVHTACYLNLIIITS